MDCNKEGALTAKRVAEKKFAEKDYNGAKKFAERAKEMFPGLDFISLFITIIDIYCCRERMVEGQPQPDWRGILRVEETATDTKICKSYCRLSLDVQAERENVVGAEGAFQILSEAWCVLSNTFWTKCSTCGFHFQYDRARVNKKLICINCGGCFLAMPLPPGNHPTNQRPMSCFSQGQDMSHHGAGSGSGSGAVLALKSASSGRAGGKGVLKHSQRMEKDYGESSNKALMVDGHEARLVPGVGSTSPGHVGGNGTLIRYKMAGRDAMSS